MKFKEFSCKQVDNLINARIKDNPKVKIVDVKFCANGFGSHALVIYEEDFKNGRK